MDEDLIKTQMITKIRWLPPVETTDQLPVDGVEEGTHCFVEGPDHEGEEEVWKFEGGRWVREDSL